MEGTLPQAPQHMGRGMRVWLYAKGLGDQGVRRIGEDGR